MTTIGYVALEAYLKWRAGMINNEDFQGTLNTLGYKIKIEESEVSLLRNILSEME